MSDLKYPAPAKGTFGDEALLKVLERQRSCFIKEGPPSYKERMAQLDKLMALTRKNIDVIIDAVVADYGSRSRHETMLTELFLVATGTQYIQTHLKGWMKPQRRATSLVCQLAKSRVLHQPLGVVGIISPWNYPFYLSFMPAVTALAAGNRVMLKPSRFTPNTAKCLSRLIGEMFSPDVAYVVEGGPGVGASFASLPFDHILFTGSPAVGSQVMRAASANLTPVTLELGGKSPVIIDKDFDLARAAEIVCTGKFFNSGQTCVAPDYLFIHKDKVNDFVGHFRNTVRKFYPTLKNNPDYTAIVNDHHYKRLVGVLAEAAERGATLIEVNPANETLEPSGRKLAPTLILNAPLDTALMTDEIFGPILPVIGYTDLDEALAYVNARPRPLALYYCDDNNKRAEHVLSRTTSGGAGINITMLHGAQDDLPFGGVGYSGMGRWHAREGFETLSNKKNVLYQGRPNALFMMRPPYTNFLDKMVRFLIGKYGCWVLR
ncbi:MAG: coniferyl aldehyde dehydrogenase [Dehalococcoidia bacterium]|jgi:coniferyl-aldehyde dehydrogenase